MLFYLGFYASNALYSGLAVRLPGGEGSGWSRCHKVVRMANTPSCTINLSGNAPVRSPAGLWMLGAREETVMPVVPLCDLVHCCAIRY